MKNDTLTQCAVILVAGEGKRMRPFTYQNPKCFAEVLNCRILDNTLNSLASNGCKKIRLITGHLSENIRDYIKTPYQGMEINFINNPIFNKTNNMYSLFLGLEHLNEPTWVIEGDIFFENTILALPSKSDIAWYVDSSERICDGAYIETDVYGRAISIVITRDPSTLDTNHKKSIGILKLSKCAVKKIHYWLDRGIKSGRENDYYDQIIGEQITNINTRIVDVAGYKWYEIDDELDLDKAREVFK